MVLERAPVWRFRWNVRSRLWRCLVRKMVQMRGKRDWRKTRTWKHFERSAWCCAAPLWQTPRSWARWSQGQRLALLHIQPDLMRFMRIQSLSSLKQEPIPSSPELLWRQWWPQLERWSGQGGALRRSSNCQLRGWGKRGRWCSKPGEEGKISMRAMFIVHPALHPSQMLCIIKVQEKPWFRFCFARWGTFAPMRRIPARATLFLIWGSPLGQMCPTITFTISFPVTYGTSEKCEDLQDLWSRSPSSPPPVQRHLEADLTLLDGNKRGPRSFPKEILCLKRWSLENTTHQYNYRGAHPC